MAKDFNDGICDNCGQTGLAGEPCVVCGATLSKIDSGDDPILNQEEDEFGKEKNEPEVYPLELVDKEESGEDSIFSERLALNGS